jgi:predicted phage tail protein
MKALSREHQAVFNFKTSMAQLKAIVTDEENIFYERFFDSFESAISDFIQTELFIRQAERCEALNVNTDFANYSRKQGMSYNDEGVRMTLMSKEFLEQFASSQSVENTFDQALQTELESFQNKMKEEFSKLEIKASDAKEIDETLTKTIGSLSNDCIEQNLLQFMENQLVELAKVRKTESRGAEKNIAAWKLIAIAVLIGVATWSIIKCKLTPWRCSSKEKRVYDTVMAIAMITFGACE